MWFFRVPLLGRREVRHVLRESLMLHRGRTGLWPERAVHAAFSDGIHGATAKLTTTMPEQAAEILSSYARSLQSAAGGGIGIAVITMTAHFSCQQFTGPPRVETDMDRFHGSS